MALEDHTYPQDAGQGLSEGDRNDAASFAQATFDPALKDVVIKGLDLHNLGSSTFDVSAGVAKLYVPSMQTKDWGDGQKTRDECLITQQVSERTGLAYDGSGTTHVFLTVDLTTDNAVAITTNGDGTQPPDPSMKLGEIDESTDTATHVNRTLATDPDHVDAKTVTATNALRVEQGRGFLGLPTHHINYEAGLTTEEIARFTLDAGQTLELWRLEVQLKGGGTTTDFSVDVYDATNGTVLASTSSKVTGGTDPLASSGDGATILVRVTNNTGNAQDATISGITDIVQT